MSQGIYNHRGQFFESIFDDMESTPVLFFVANVLITPITVDSDTQSNVNDAIMICFRYVDTDLVSVFDISFDRQGPTPAKNSLKWLATASPKVK